MKSHFVCVPVSVQCKSGLKAVQAALSTEAKTLKLEPSGIDRVHFTLSVFTISKDRKKETEEQLEQSVNKVLKEFLDERPPMNLTFGGLGSFGSNIVFISLTNEKQLEALRQDMINLLKAEGIYNADPKFSPHVTLFRYRGKRGGGNSTAVKDMIKNTRLPPVTPSPVSQILLGKLQGNA